MTLALLACPACAVEDDDLDLRYIQGTGTGSGTVFNTNQIEEVRFSELAQPMGERHLNVTLASVVLPNNTEVDRFTIDRGEIVALDDNGIKHRGAALVGSDWMVVPYMMKTPEVSMRITSFVMVGEQPHYIFQHFTDNGWIYNCPNDVSGPYKVPGLARMLSGFTLDQSSGAIDQVEDMTFIACTTGAVGKAVTWGYYDFGLDILTAQVPGPVESIDPIAPSKTIDVEAVEPEAEPGVKPAIDPIDAFEPLELAIRAVRADYCYDGHSHTTTGVPLLVEDVWGIRGPDLGREIEAVWGAHGLVCKGQGRHGLDIQSACPETVIPACIPGSVLADYPEGLIMTRIPDSTLDDEKA